MKIKRYPGSVVISTDVEKAVILKDEEGNDKFVFGLACDWAIKPYAFIANTTIDGKLAIVLTPSEDIEFGELLEAFKDNICEAYKYEAQAVLKAQQDAEEEQAKDAIINTLLAD